MGGVGSWILGGSVVGVQGGGGLAPGYLVAQWLEFRAPGYFNLVAQWLEFRAPGYFNLVAQWLEFKWLWFSLIPPRALTV